MADKKLHIYIHKNLCLLQAKGHKFKFEEGMFRDRNLPGFEAVGHALLMIIDQVQCKNTIPWPLANDKSLRNEFRSSFVKFIKMINQRYPDWRIPEITASNLLSPGGIKFLWFMYELSSFTVLLELNRMLSVKENKNRLPKPMNSKRKDQLRKAKINILRGALCKAQSNLQQCPEYQTRAAEVLRGLRNIEATLKENLELQSTKLKNAVSFTLNDQAKLDLLAIDEPDAMTEWNQRTDQKIEEILNCTEKLEKSRELSANIRQVLESAADNCTESLCLDGDKLVAKLEKPELADKMFMGCRGQVKLANVLMEAHRWAVQLNAGAQPQAPQLPRAQQLLSEAQLLLSRSKTATTTFNNLCTDSKTVVDQLKPLIYSRMREIKAPAHFKYLKTRPLLKVKLDPTYIPESPFNEEKPKRTFEELKHEMRMNHARTGRRRSSSWSSLTTHMKHPVSALRTKWKPEPSTATRVPRFFTELKPDFPRFTARKIQTQTPTCRKSLYGKLPTGSKAQLAKCISTEDLFSESFTEFSTTDPEINKESSTRKIVEDKNVISEQTPAQTKKRRSICDILDRLNKIKENAAKFENDRKLAIPEDNT